MAAKTTKKPSERPRFRLIPLTVIMLSLMLVVRLNELYLNSHDLRELYGPRSAVAASDTEAAPEAEAEKPKEGEAKSEEEETAKEEEGGHGSGHGESKPKEVEEPKTLGTGKTTIKEIEALKAREATPRFTQTEIDLLQNLAKRREEIDAREKEIAMKSDVLAASEKRIADKINEMKTLQSQLEKVIAQYNEKQSGQVKSLVKIYENMKPGDAASIFNELEMPILLEVIDQMSERKVAPVLAAMSTKKARDVTQELAEMRRNAPKLGGASAR